LIKQEEQILNVEKDDIKKLPFYEYLEASSVESWLIYVICAGKYIFI